jgi:hypothetical protein
MPGTPGLGAQNTSLCAVPGCKTGGRTDDLAAPPLRGSAQGAPSGALRSTQMVPRAPLTTARDRSAIRMTEISSCKTSEMRCKQLTNGHSLGVCEVAKSGDWASLKTASATFCTKKSQYGRLRCGKYPQRTHFRLPSGNVSSRWRAQAALYGRVVGRDLVLRNPGFYEALRCLAKKSENFVNTWHICARLLHWYLQASRGTGARCPSESVKKYCGVA